LAAAFLAGALTAGFEGLVCLEADLFVGAGVYFFTIGSLSFLTGFVATFFAAAFFGAFWICLVFFGSAAFFGAGPLVVFGATFGFEGDFSLFGVGGTGVETAGLVYSTLTGAGVKTSVFGVLVLMSDLAFALSSWSVSLSLSWTSCFYFLS